jgi:signal transduction histidine kinase
MVALFLLAAAVSMVVRHRHSGLVVRRQLQAVGFVAAVVALCWIVGIGVKGFIKLSPNLNDLDGALVGLATAGLAVALGMAILRGKLIEPRLVVSRMLAYGTLVGLTTAAYVLIVAGAGVMAGGRLSLPLAGLVTAALALTLQPVRVWARRLADRVVYGRRAEPYEVLAQFTRRVASALPAGNEVSAMARVLAEGTGSARAEVWIATPDGRQLLSAAGAELTGIATEVEVTKQGQVTGWLRLVRPSGDPLRAREERLFIDLAHQAGMVLEQARLTAELRASRRRLVAAQDQERERLERDLHDGAQQHLLALSARIGILPEGEAAQMREEVAAAMDSLREVARGLYPKLLETGGLRPALSAQARRLPIPVRVAVAAGRLPREVEVAIYYCCSEALQNVARHSGARRAQLMVKSTEGAVEFEVADDGCGLIAAGAAGGNGTGRAAGVGLGNMRDRVEVLDGTLEIDSEPSRGTTIRGWVPV